MFSFFKNLPEEMTQEIISKLNNAERAKAARTCKQFNRIKTKVDQLHKDLDTAIVNIIYTFSYETKEIEHWTKKLKFCLSAGANPNMISYIGNDYVLCRVAKEASANCKGGLIAAEILLQHGAIVNTASPTPLYMAALYGNAKMAKLLINHGSTGFIGREKDGDVRDYPYLYKAIMTNQGWEEAFQEEIDKGLAYSMFNGFQRSVEYTRMKM